MWRLSRILAKGAYARLFLLVLCVAIGVAARAFVGTITTQADIALSREARPLLGGDLEIAGNSPIHDDIISDIQAQISQPYATCRTSSLVSMAASATSSRLIELRAVDGQFPLLTPVPFAAALPGVTTLQDALSAQPISVIAPSADTADTADTADKQTQQRFGVAMEASGLTALGISLGDTITLGTTGFQVRAVLGEDPSLTGSPFTLGPRVVCHQDALSSTGLTDFGARVRYTLLIRLDDPSASETIAADLATTWKLPDTEMGFGARGAGEHGVQIRTARQAQFGLRRVFDRLGDFLRLAALGSLLVAAVGVAALVSATIRARADDLALLATLGCSPRTAGRLLYLQILAATTVGAVIGSAFGGLAAYGIISVAREAFPLPIEPGWAPISLLTGAGIGIIVANAVALVALIGLRSLQPLAIFRGEQPTLRAGWRALPSALVAFALTTAIAMWEAHSFMVGLAFTVSLAVGSLAARMVIHNLVRGIAYCRTGPSALRLAMANMGRPQLSVATTTTALAIATALVIGPIIHRATIMQVLARAGSDAIPALFIVDLRPDDVATVTTTLTEFPNSTAQGLSPIVTARYRGKVSDSTETPASQAATREGQRAQFFRNREQRLSWRKQPGPDEKIIRGRWAQPAVDGSSECTLDADFAKRLGADIGDVLIFDCQGIPIHTTVVGLREVDFLGLKPNFFILVDDEILRDAPQTWIAAITTPQPDAVLRRLNHVIPTATIIDVSAIAHQVGTVVTRILQALTTVAAIAVLAGCMVLAALTAASARERRADAALLRVLGATNNQLRLAAGSEFFMQGCLAVGIGCAVGIGITTIGLRLIDLSPTIPWATCAVVGGSIILLTTLVGLLSVRQTWHAPPLTVLRQE